MNGAESLVHTLLAGDVDVCFTNPGTSEMHFVAALDKIEGMRCVLCLFEGVVSGAADGYARMAGKPAATLLHLGPGLGNALANLHNAKKARSPVVNVVGEHATYHIQYNTPLTSDIEGIARPVSGWVKTAPDSASVGPDGAAAIAASRAAPGQVATLILPGDTAWDDGGVVGTVPDVPGPEAVDGKLIDEVAKQMRGDERTLLLLGAGALFEEPLEIAGTIAAATGCDVLAEGMNSRLQRGAGRLFVERVPYPVDQALKVLAPYQRIILAGAGVPAVFFAYPNKPSLLAPEGCETIKLAEPHQDCAGALRALADAVGAKPGTAKLQEAARPERPSGPITPWVATSAQASPRMHPRQARDRGSHSADRNTPTRNCATNPIPPRPTNISKRFEGNVAAIGASDNTIPAHQNRASASRRSRGARASARARETTIARCRVARRVNAISSVSWCRACGWFPPASG